MIKSIIQWEISIAKFSAVIGGMLGVVFFLFGNTLGQAVTDNSVGFIEAILYLVRTIFALFLFGSVLSIILHILGALTSMIRSNKT